MAGKVLTLTGGFTLPDIADALKDARKKCSSPMGDLNAVSWGQPTTDAAWS